MGSLSTTEQRKLAYFHALAKVMTENTQAVYESKYKSSHNIRLDEVWSDDIGYAISPAAAQAEALSNSAVTYHDKVTLTEIPGSNGQAYYFNSGGTFMRPWIAPTDVPHLVTNDPSYGYQLRLFRQNDTEIYLTTGAWSVDYYASIIHFSENYTPADLGWGAIKSSIFQYTGGFGASGSTDPNAFTTVYFDTNTDLLWFNSGLTNEQIVDLSSLKAVSGTTSIIAPDNDNMVANVTSSVSKLACNTPLNTTNITGSVVLVYVNGVRINVGNLTTDDCFFSDDGGSTKKVPGTATIGDLLYWNYNGVNPIIGYELSTIDRLTFTYLSLS